MLNLWEIYKIKILAIVIFTLIIAFIGIYIYADTLKSEVTTLNTSLNTTKSLLEVEKANNISLKASIDSRNIEIEKQKINLSKKMEELEEWKNRPPDIKYKEVIKYKEIKSNECKDIKNIIDSIRNISI
ncbi:hypothetical protein [Aliarcobacter butzleri]|uniref:Uncharacterized protein n=1 Tax=Aliarcobacter butzleri L348 TaxID=1447256 RepID=A0A0G9KDD3_9BACT|nr:hypothetical protein [Aliarcobacter butzleri]KLE02203.1 hypothetical protein AA20_01205 [Aliarcobacter butzleri L348]